MRSHWKDMDPVDDFITQNTPGLKITRRSGAACNAPTTALPRALTSRALLAPMPHGLCGVPHHAYVISGSMEVIYKDGSVETCKAGDVCYWPAPHNFKSKEGAEIIQFSGSGDTGCAGQGDREFDGEDEEVSVDEPDSPQCAPRLSPFSRMTGRGLPELAGPVIVMAQ